MMRIDRKAITEAILPKIFLLNPQNEHFLKWEALVFWDERDNMQADFSVRLPFTVLLGLLLLLTGANLFFQWNRYYAFSTEGVMAQEELIRKDTATMQARQLYYLNYRYSYGTEQFTLTRQVNSSTYESATIGTVREVLLLPNYRELMLDNLGELLPVLWFSVIVFLFICGLSLFCINRFYRTVLLIPAQITAVEQGEKHTNRGVHPTYEISFEFTSPKTKKLLKGQQTLIAGYRTPQTEQLLALFYFSDTDIVFL